jgi:hypothetical protein
MNKGQLIEQIRELNPSAAIDFLKQFEEQELDKYLESLRSALAKRVHIHGFVRRETELRVAS